ncbi:MAG: mechanosensitive ion channel family protein [Chloroflexota bacterium]|nr:mechanosensitive ion channel family protein [Chloroflexota bacterium]
MKPKRIVVKFALIAMIILGILTACSSASPDQASEPQLSATLTPVPDEGAVQPTATPLLGEFVTERTPQPTSTPGQLMQSIETFAARKGVLFTKFLGIRLVDWINLGISALIVLVGYLLGTWLIKGLLPRLVKRTQTTFDDELLKKVGPEIRWLVTLIILNFAVTDRLTFIGDGFMQTLKDIFFILTLSLLVWIIWEVINLSADWYAEKQTRDGRENLTSVIQMITKFIQIVIGIIGVSILLSYFGVNVSTLTAALGIGGFAISLAAKDTVSDAIAGIILLVDQPFRVGDRIEVQELATWGDVVEIGLRTTHIRTRDNRMVIVPNSIISHNQVINYSFPDPRYRIETHVDIDYREDVEMVRQLLIKAVRQVEGVLADKPVDALYIDMTGSTIKFLLRWWIDSYLDSRRMIDYIHTVIQHAFNEAGIQSPHIANNINLMMDSRTEAYITKNFTSQSSEGAARSENPLISDTERDLDP